MTEWWPTIFLSLLTAIYWALLWKIDNLQGQIGRMKDIIDGHLAVLKKYDERLKNLEGK